MRFMSIEHAPLVPAASRFTTGGSTPPPTVPVDAYRHEDLLVLRCDLPGVDPDTIEVAIDDRTLSVQAERSLGPAPGDAVILCERPAGPLYRSVTLPEDTDPENALADFDGGVLTVTIPLVDSVPAGLGGALTMPPEVEAVREPTLPTPSRFLAPGEPFDDFPLT